jgi:ABC-type Zn uptake system ZnuABC Zn-binding protein ZnuA
MRSRAAVLLVVVVLALGGCGSAGTTEEGAPLDEMPVLSAVALQAGDRLRAIATTSIVGDVVRQVGGDWIDLRVLMPVGVDPHSFEPAPQDMARVADAHVVFASGAGLEVFLERLLDSAGGEARVVPLSAGVELHGVAGEDGDHDHGEADPHVWLDPNNVVIWTHNVEQSLRALDPAHADAYAANAVAYAAKLAELDAWIREEVARVPAADRKLVTDHTSFTYLAQRYGFVQVGAVFPGYSTLSEPSARELAALEDAIRTLDVRAVFVGITVNPDLADRIVTDTGTVLVPLYTGSLSGPEGPAGDYISLMRYNVSAIVDALE